MFERRTVSVKYYFSTHIQRPKRTNIPQTANLENGEF